jgi:hypothetical protein
MFIEYRPGEFIRAEEIKKVIAHHFHYNAVKTAHGEETDRERDEWALDLYGPAGYSHDGSYGDSSLIYLARIYFKTEQQRNAALSTILAVGNQSSLSCFSLSSAYPIKQPERNEDTEYLEGFIY